MARPGSSLRRLFAPLVGLLLLGALVAGCAPARGAAATVDGVAIGENAVADVVAEMNEVITAETEQAVLDSNPDATADDIAQAVQQQQVRPTQALLFLIADNAILDSAAEAGLAVSEDDALQAWAARRTAAGLDERAPSDVTLTYVRGQMAVAAINNDGNGAEIWAGLGERLGELDVTLSPRYGTWDPAGEIHQRSVDWILQPAAA